MKSSQHFSSLALLLLSFFFLSSAAYGFAVQDTAAADTTEDGYPKYLHVDVEVNYGWGDPEKDENVDVAVKLKGKDPGEVIIFRGDLSKCEIFLREGMVVKIYNHKTKKLIRTVTGK